MKVIDTGDTAWMLISTALVCLMTPGLAFFYGGMVKTRNVISTLFQSFIALGVVGVLWALFGYSLVFSGDFHGLIGNFHWAMLKGVGEAPLTAYAPTIPHQVFMLFQCMFAVITPALMTGAFAERMQFKAWLLLLTLWSIFIYLPIAHSVWAVGGLIHDSGALDFAGGMVVHMSAGFSALVMALMLRKRVAIKEEHQPHDVGMILLGAALLWFGWFGFNAGSALSAGGLAALAFSTTFFAGAAAMVAWVVTDVFVKGQPTATGAAVGCVVGLVAITPAAGFVSPMSALLIGLIAGVACNLSSVFIKEKLHLDDTLDVFGCHGLGGIFGTLLTGLFAEKSLNSAGANGLFFGNGALLKTQALSCLAVGAFSMIGTFFLVKLIRLFMVMEVSEVEEITGLDMSQHGERLGVIGASAKAELPAVIGWGERFRDLGSH